MKIAHVISSCSAGGAEMFIKSLLKSLKNKDEISEIQLWSMTNISKLYPNNSKKIKFEQNFINELKNSNINVKMINKRPHKDWIKTKKKLRKLYKDFKPDIVHSHLESVTFHTCRALSKFKVPIIQTIHSSVINHLFVQKYYIKKRVSAYVSISEQLQQIINDKIGIKEENNYLIYNGVNIEEFKNENRKINDEAKKIISIGRLTPAKDYKNLFNAIKILEKKLKKDKSKIPEFLIVGDGELEKDLKELSKNLNIDDNVNFLGLRDDIPELLSESDIYVMSSEWEGLSIALIEAAASGIPIIATNAGSNSEIINDGENGMIVSVKNSEVLADRLYKLIKNKKLRKKISKNNDNVIGKFSIKNSTGKHLDMYRNEMRKRCD